LLIERLHNRRNLIERRDFFNHDALI